MQIVCPNCGTSYDVNPSTLGPAGRTVRCVRCKETWLARVDDMARADALAQAAEEIGWDQPAQRPAVAEAVPDEHSGREVPQIESPPLAHDGPSAAATGNAQAEDGPAVSRPAKSRRGTLPEIRVRLGPGEKPELQPADGDCGDGGAGACADLLAQ